MRRMVSSWKLLSSSTSFKCTRLRGGAALACRAAVAVRDAGCYGAYRHGFPRVSSQARVNVAVEVEKPFPLVLPKVIGVLTHLDAFRENKQLRKVACRAKQLLRHKLDNSSVMLKHRSRKA